MGSLIAALAPVLIVIPIIVIWVTLKTRNRRSPAPHKLLRSPGESLSQWHESEAETLSLALMVMFFLPPFVWAQISTTRIAPFVGLGLLGLYVPALVWLWKLMNSVKGKRLGLMGERAVGEEINKLMLSDYHVYHDLLKKPEDPENRSNIDHIIVGRTGVYAVETKARTIVELKHGGRDDKVTFNGNTLKFPNWENSKDVTQARNHATWLTAYLKSELGLEVEVRGILILPGWNVESKVYNRALRVLEGGRREIKSAIETDTEELLDEQQIKIIVDHFEERCRDVEW